MATLQSRKPFFSRLGRPLTLRRIYASAVRRFLHRTFPLWERLGIHAVPVHFYYPIPNTRDLPDSLWSKQYALTGLNLKPEEQLELLRAFGAYRAEYESFPLERTPSGFYVNNGRFQAVDAEILYCMIRHFMPRRIYEIGSGFSTKLAVAAASKNETEGAPPCQITAIEPWPTIDLLALRNVRLLRMPVERLPLDEFDQLQANDILFIDSSHSIRTGGDVIREHLEIIPRLRPGVIVHCHDIFLPAEYPRQFVTGVHTFWSEQYLFHGFLLFNNQFDIMWAGHYLHLNYRDKLNEAFTSYSKCATPPSSFWIRRTTAG